MSLNLKVPPVIVFALAVLFAWWLTQFHWLPLPEASRAIGGMVFSIGVFCGVAGVIAFRQHQTTVNPHKPQNASHVVNTGIFAYTRNPMYLGLALGVLGVVLYLRDGTGLVAVPVFMAYIQRFQIVPEEQILTEKFGAAFADYCAQTARWFGRNPS